MIKAFYTRVWKYHSSIVQNNDKTNENRIDIYTRKNMIYSGESMSQGKVGSKGELFPPKELRERIGLKEGEPVLYRVVQDRLIVEKLYSVEEILQKPAKVTLTPEEIKRDRERLFEDASK